MSPSTRLDAARLDRFDGRAVLVVGDSILDRYWHGHVSRISPEAPVPVVRWEREEDRPGGAANVVANVVALGGAARLVSVAGNDEEAEKLGALLDACGVPTDGLVRVASRPTTVKARILARHQQVARLDREESAPVPDDVAAEIVRRALARLAGADAVVISDYAKGAVDARVLRPVLVAAREQGIPVVVDPKIRNVDAYEPATVLTPNEAEAARAAAIEAGGREQTVRAARLVLERLDVGACLVTRGEAGMLLVERGREAIDIPALAREVFDVTGAGDTVVATLAVGLAAGLPLEEAARWSNAAGALSVGRLGTAAVSRGDLARLAARA